MGLVEAVVGHHDAQPALSATGVHSSQRTIDVPRLVVFNLEINFG